MRMTIIYIVLEKNWIELRKNYLNSGSFHYMCFGKIKENDKFNFENISQEVVILVFTIDNKLFLDYRVKEICRKASQKT